MKNQFILFMSMVLLGTFLSIPKAISAAQNSKENTQIGDVKITPKTNDEKHNFHCVSKVKIEFSKVYMTPEWMPLASQLALSKWQKRVTAQYGSVYSEWQQSSEKVSRCNRIGFGNDDHGNIGNTVLCEISAIPCVKMN